MYAGRTAVAAGLVGVAVLAFSAPTAVSAFADKSVAVAVAPSVVCGTDPTTGLAVWAGKTAPCSTAMQVAAAYTRVWNTGLVVTVRVEGSEWRCQERQGDPNPYKECVNTTDNGQRVTLTS